MAWLAREAGAHLNEAFSWAAHVHLPKRSPVVAVRHRVTDVAGDAATTLFGGPAEPVGVKLDQQELKAAGVTESQAGLVRRPAPRNVAPSEPLVALR